MRYFTWYLNTQSASAQSKPYNKSNLANCSYYVNWNSLFRNCDTLLRKPEVRCRLRVELISQQSSAVTFPGNEGTLRINFGCSSQNTNLGVLCGFVKPLASPVTAGSYYLNVDTTSSPGIEINAPVDMTDISLRFYTSAEVLMTNVPEYEVFLHFEIEDAADE